MQVTDYRHNNIIGHHPYSDVLVRKLYNCSGRDLLSIMHIHLTVRCKFGVVLLFGSEVIICRRKESETGIIELSDTTTRCFL